MTSPATDKVINEVVQYHMENRIMDKHIKKVDLLGLIIASSGLVGILVYVFHQIATLP